MQLKHYTICVTVKIYNTTTTAVPYYYLTKTCYAQKPPIKIDNCH